ncbi:MAG: DUF559 domain-containing protein [Chloroflexi bacterium]|nr:DUF559 domain-containing protein [Chloroflexota bacterium]
MRSQAQWDKWFSQREGKKRRKFGKHSGQNKGKRNSNLGVSASVVAFPRVVGDPISFRSTPSRSSILQIADRHRKNPTRAEAEFRNILNQLNGGVLRGKFKREHAVSGKWIVDFFFPEIRLAVEIDGSVHLTDEQRKRDKLKDEDCARFDITVLRITNREVFGNRKALISKLRAGWRQALSRNNRIIGSYASD